MKFLSKIFSPLTRQDTLPSGARPKASVQMPPQGFYKKSVKDVCIPKATITAVPVDLKKQDLVNVFRESGLSRLPVYEGTLDKPIGFVLLKDFALRDGFDSPNSARFSLRSLLRPLLFVPPSMPVFTLLQKMQAERVHMALVIDEYGGVDGLVTIEDLIEQAVGEIEDEHDPDEEENWVKERNGVFNVLAHTSLEDFEEEFGKSLKIDTDDDIDTLGGLVFSLIGRVPVRGEVIFHPDGHEFEVLDADLRRIKKLRVFSCENSQRL